VRIRWSHAGDGADARRGPGARLQRRPPLTRRSPPNAAIRVTWFGSGLEGEPPATLYGAMQFIPSGESDCLHLDLESGRRCLITDPEAGQHEVFEVG
jgi:hypothetical protein